MPLFDITEKRPNINIFKLSGANYFKHFFDDPELFRSLSRTMRRLDTDSGWRPAGERNKVMKLLDMRAMTLL